MTETTLIPAKSRETTPSDVSGPRAAGTSSRLFCVRFIHPRTQQRDERVWLAPHRGAAMAYLIRLEPRVDLESVTIGPIR